MCSVTVRICEATGDKEKLESYMETFRKEADS
jgi:hypothetical protein